MQDEQIVTDVVDDDKEVTEEDLRKSKEEVAVESSKETDEAPETDTAEEEPEEAEEEETPSFVKEFPHIKGDTPEEYAKNLEEAYKNSTTEALRLKGLAERSTETEEDTPPVDSSDPTSLYIKQKMDEEMATAYTSFQKKYPQAAPGTPEFDTFVREVDFLSRTILSSQGRLAPPAELYQKAAVILGWEADKVDDKDKLSAALKDSAASSRTTTSTKKAPKSKVTDAEIAIAKKTWAAGKSDADIRAELEQYTN